MNLKEIIADDDAVSPVIGVILMVAITVILAAVIGTFVLGLGDQVQDTAPNTQLSTSQESVLISDGSNEASFNEVELVHQGGDKLQEDNIDVTVNGDTAYAVDEGTTTFTSVWDDGGEVTAGNSARIVAYNSTDMDGETYAVETSTPKLAMDSTGNADNSLSADDTIRVTWESDDGSSSSTLLSKDVN